MQVFVRGKDRIGEAFDVRVDTDNVSRGGLMFRTDHDIPLGSQLEIVVRRLPIGGREFEPLFTTGRVVRTSLAKDSPGFEVGVEFTGPRLQVFSAEST